MGRLTIKQLHKAYGFTWSTFISMYGDVFPARERESIRSMTESVRKKVYKVYIVRMKTGIIGFYVVHENIKHKYVLLSYLSMCTTVQGRGYGSEVFSYVVNSYANHPQFDWIVLEAKDRQAKWYAGMGMKRVDLDYSYPHADNTASSTINLMLKHTNTPQPIVGGEFLRDFVESAFTGPYNLDASDARLDEQWIRIHRFAVLQGVEDYKYD